MDDRYSNAQLKLVTDSPPAKLENQEWKQIRRNRLINSLNRINFQDGEVFLNFKHTKYDTILSLPAKPQPCLDKYLNCFWGESFDYKMKLKDFKFKEFHFTDGLKKILVDAELLSINNDSIQLSLPDSCQAIHSRKVKRYQCNDVLTQLSQDGIVNEGFLTSFSAVSFSVHIKEDSHSFHQSFDRETPVRVVLKKDSEPLYSGLCEILRISKNSDGKFIVLIPKKSHIQRFDSKKHRSIRQKLLPSPNIIFKHPLFDKIVNLRALDISGAGFSLEEDVENSLLIPGMVLPDMSIELMNGVELKCKAQIIYRTIEEIGKVKCGIAFLDMSINDQIKLSSLLHQIKNKNSYVCTKIDINDLWDFFFESGFIYPSKYSFIQKNKIEFNRIYKKLYENNPDIAINFIYKDKGSIIAHMSMFRFYEKTWIINHHAAISSRNNKAGLVVLEQTSNYINDFHRLNSTKMQYVACYFRPENKFPNIVFGGVLRKVSDFKVCSADKFIYLLISKSKLDANLSSRWRLNKAKKCDLDALKDFYKKMSNGLTLKALDLDAQQMNLTESISESYQTLGFKREKHVYALKKADTVYAVFVVNISDIGMNMSDLTNCIQIFVLDQKLSTQIIKAALSKLSSYYEHENLPVLIFPSSYAQENSIPFDKTYNFWVLDVHRIGDRYLDHLYRLLRRSK